MSHRRTALIGIVCGAVAVALLMAPVDTPLVAAGALLAPIAGGAIAAVLRGREAKRELGVDEAMGAGARVGLIGGFIAAVPFPLALNLYAERQAEVRATGVALSIGAAAVVLVVFLTLAVVAAVIAARVAPGK